MADLTATLAKLRALKAKTVENGCTEDEAMAAAEKMAELLSRHGLSEEDLAGAEYSETTIGLGRRSPLDRAWFSVARFADCKGWYNQDGRKWTFTFFGRTQDVLVAEYVRDVLTGACEQALASFRSTETYTKRRKVSTRNKAVKAFLEALANGLIGKLNSGLWRRYGGPADGEKALQLIRENTAHLETELGRKGLKFGKARALAVAEGTFRNEARHHGYKAARAIEVNAGVTAGNKVAGLLR